MVDEESKTPVKNQASSNQLDNSHRQGLLSDEEMKQDVDDCQSINSSDDIAAIQVPLPQRHSSSDFRLHNFGMLIPSQAQANSSQQEEECKGSITSLTSEHLEFTPFKVLLVDDNVFNLIALNSLFKQFGVECDQAFNGTESIKKVRNLSESGQPLYKLIMMDYSMPDCNGPEATRQIRELLNERGVPR